MASLYQPLRTEDGQPEHDSYEDNPPEDDSYDMLREDQQKKTRDPLYIIILYATSLLVSIGGLGAGIWGYCIVVTGPLDEYSKKVERAGYEKYFWGMQSVVVLLTINVLWTGLNYRLALKAKQNSLWFLNMIYDFLIWATLIAFGVLNMVQMLWDRRLCDGWNDTEMYKKCDIVMFRLLVVEMVAVNLGLLAAVLHFILLVARCCAQENIENVSIRLRKRVHEEEELLLLLIERRRQLTLENEELEARRLGTNRELPPLPTEPSEFGAFHEDAEIEDEEGYAGNLIDISDEQIDVAEETSSPAITASGTRAAVEREAQQL